MISTDNYDIVIKRDEISNLQIKFNDILKYETETIKNCNFGFQGGNHNADLFWSSRNNFWYASTDNKDNTRYLNYFGLEKPIRNVAEQIGQISISHEDSKTEGLFIKERNTENVYVAHRGGFTINSSKTSIKGNIFDGFKYSGECIMIAGKNIALIGVLPNDERNNLDFQCKVKDFIVELEIIKKYVRENTNTRDNDILHNDKKHKINQEIKQEAVSKKIEKSEKLLVNINEAFIKILPSVVNFISNAFIKENKNWKKFVSYNLSDTAINNLHLEGTIDDFARNLDILTSFHIIINNWNDIFMEEIARTSRKYFLDYTHHLKTIRNNIQAHITMNVIERYNKERFELDLGTMILFMEQIDKNTANELRDMKNK